MAIFETGARGAKCCRRLRGSTLRRAFHGLTPTAKCCRRLRGSVGTPGLAPGDYHYLNRRPSGVWQFLRQGLSVRLSAAAAFAAQHCAELSMGSRPRLSAAAAFAAQHCAELSMGSRPRLSAAAAFAAQHCAELSMGLRPRLSAAAFAAQRDGDIRFHGLTPTAKCCRRLRGSTLRRAFHGLTPTAKCCRRLRGSKGWGHPVPWAYAHGYLRTPRSRLFGTPGLTPGGLSIKNPVPAAPGGRRIPRRRLVAKNLFPF